MRTLSLIALLFIMVLAMSAFTVAQDASADDDSDDSDAAENTSAADVAAAPKTAQTATTRSTGATTRSVPAPATSSNMHQAAGPRAIDLGDDAPETFVNSNPSGFGSDGCNAPDSTAVKPSYARVPNLKAAAMGAVNDALNDAKQEVMDKAMQLKADIQAQLQAKAQQMLTDCANGLGPLAALQAGCKLLVNGVSIDADGLSIAFVQNINIGADFSTPTISGTIDLSSWFSISVPAFDFVLTISPKSKSLSLSFTFQGGLTLSAAGLLKAAIPHGLGLGPVIDSTVSALGLDKLSLTLDVIGINLNPFGLRLSGSCNLFGLDLNFNIMVGRLAGKFGVALNFQIPGAIVQVALSKILGSAANAMTLFVVRSIDFSLSTITANLANSPVLAFDPDNTDLNRGFQLVMKAEFDPHISNPFVKMLSKFFPGVWQVKALFDGTKFKLTLSVPKTHLSSNVDLTFSLFVAGSISPPKFQLGVQGVMNVVIYGDIVVFSAMASIILTNPAVMISLSMLGKWPRAFGIPKLVISDLVGELSIMAAAPWFNSMTLGGTITIGECSDKDRIQGKMYFRIDVVDVSGSYYYGSINRLVIGQFMSIIFGVNNLPSLLAESGYPTGMMASYAFQDGHTAAGDFIPMGYHFKGSAQFLGVGGNMEVIISPLHMLFHIEFLPFSKGPIKFLRSPTDTTHGPIGHVEARLSPFGFTCKIQAYIDLFLFKSMVDIQVDASSMKIYIATTLFGWLTAQLNITASYGGNLANAHFAFNAVIKTEDIKASTIQSINGFKSACTAALDRKIADLNREEDKAKAKVDGVCNADKSCGMNCNVKLLEEAGISWISEKDTELYTVSMQEWRHLQTLIEVEEIASLSEKELESRGVLVEIEEGTEVEGMVIHKCCSWLKKTVKSAGNVAKKAFNGAKNVAKKAVNGAKNVATKAYNGAKKVVSKAVNLACKGAKTVCKAGCNGVKAVGKLAVTGAYGLAKAAVAATKLIVSGVLSAITAILQNFAIHMEIGGSLDAENFNFHARFALKLGSFSVDFGVTINFRVSSITAIAIKVFEQVKAFLMKRVSGLSKLF